jgi:hypothetical protein
VKAWPIAAFVLVLSAWAQQEDWTCPMDPDVHAAAPGKCPRCGMALVAKLPEALEYPVRIQTNPTVLRAGEPVELRFQVLDPKTGTPVQKFEIVHEKLLHFFVVSRDLAFFVHDHPVPQPDGSFRFRTVFPQPGEYRLLCDFYPAGGTPQMIARTLVVPGEAVRPNALVSDLAPKECANLRVELQTEPQQPLAGQKTMLFFKLSPSEGLEPYLGAAGHMLAASEDLIDMIHTHPAHAGPEQFDVIFPRPGIYRIWVQFQRLGVVNTATFNLSVGELR